MVRFVISECDAAILFHFSLCLDSFVWRKKIEKEVIKGELDPRTMTLQNEKNRLASRMVSVAYYALCGNDDDYE